MKKARSKKQKNLNVKKEDANRKTSILFTQLGLVLALLLTYIAIESKTPVINDFANIPTTSFGFDENLIPDTTPEKPKPKELPAQVLPEPTLVDPQIIDDDSDLIESVIDIEGLNPDAPVKIIVIPDINPIEPEEKEDVPFYIIEYAPIFPGCEGSKEEMKACFAKSVTKLIQRKFNASLAEELALAPGKKRIAVQFTVNKEGKIADILVRAPHKSLENEARRVVNLLPDMTPGKQRGRAVGVTFTLPITLQVE